MQKNGMLAVLKNMENLQDMEESRSLFICIPALKLYVKLLWKLMQAFETEHGS